MKLRDAARRERQKAEAAARREEEVAAKKRARDESRAKAAARRTAGKHETIVVGEVIHRLVILPSIRISAGLLRNQEHGGAQIRNSLRLSTSQGARVDNPCRNDFP